MQVNCPSCSTPVPAQNVNLDQLVAKCGLCHGVFDIRAHVGRSANLDRDFPSRRERPMVALPTNIRVVTDEAEQSVDTYRTHGAPGRRVVVERRWFHTGLIFLAFFCVAWDSFLFFWYSNVGRGSGDASWFMALFPIAHVAVGVSLTYSTLCGFVNRTRIMIDNGTLTVRHGPLPWRGNRTVAVDDLAQLYAREITKSKGRTYELNAILKSGDTVTLLRGLPERDQAVYLETLLESRLGIVDVPVTGEIL